MTECMIRVASAPALNSVGPGFKFQSETNCVDWGFFSFFPICPIWCHHNQIMLWLFPSRAVRFIIH